MVTRRITQNRFSERVRSERESHGWTQAEVADMLSRAGTKMHWTTLAKIEKVERAVRIDEAAAFAELFGCSIDALVGRRSEPEGDLMMAVRSLLDAKASAELQATAAARALREFASTVSDVDDTDVFGELVEDAQATATALDTAAQLARRVGERPKTGISKAIQQITAGELT